MKKLLAFDIDGTSINPFRYVTKKTQETLLKLHEEGYILVPTTGRCLDGIPRRILDLGVCEYAITSNGSRITNLKTNEDIYTELIPDDKAIEVLNLEKHFKTFVSLHVNRTSYDNHWTQYLARRILFLDDFKRNPVVRDLYKFIEEEHFDVEKIQIFSFSQGKLNRMTQSLSKIDCINIPMSSKNYYEITAANADKGTALKWLLDRLEIDVKNTITIGDDMNDVPMLKVSGTSIAMCNAQYDVKKHANYIAPKNSQNGFAKILSKLLLQNTK